MELSTKTLKKNTTEKSETSRKILTAETFLPFYGLAMAQHLLEESDMMSC